MKITVSLGPPATPTVKAALEHAKEFPDHNPIVVFDPSNKTPWVDREMAFCQGESPMTAQPHWMFREDWPTG